MDSRGAAWEGMVQGDPAFAGQVEAIEFLLRSVANLVRQRGRQIMAGFDITPPQFNALILLSRRGNLTMGELCQGLYLASSTVTDLVDRMERNNLLQRVRDADDRRVVRLRLQPRGERIIADVMRARKAYLAGILERAAPDERHALEQSLHQIHDLMTEREADPIAGH